MGGMIHKLDKIDDLVRDLDLVIQVRASHG